ncbi:MAG: hypothetical protein MJ240_00280 [Kiritimatiellae bacterium]|nr:hypothetical protein [Kiritimatiellia bacterium]
MKNLFVLALACGLGVVASAKDDLVISAADGFAAVTRVSNARMERTPTSLVFTDILPDMQVYLKTPVVFSGEIEGFEFRYRASGPTPKPKAGGELFYAAFGASFSDARAWSIPALVRDGEWHTLRLTLSAIRKPAEWEASGRMTKFRLDPTNAEGGKIEISEIRFIRRGASAKAAVRTAKFHGEDAWPEVTPELFRHAQPPPLEKVEAALVELQGGTAVPRVQTAGQKVHLRYDYRGPEPKGEFLTGKLLMLTPKGTLKWCEPLTLARAQVLTRMADDRWALEFDYEVPPYLGEGTCDVSFDVVGVKPCKGRETGARLTVKRLAVDPDWAAPISAKVVDVAGTPAFAVNGTPVYPLWGTIAYGRHAEEHPSRHSSAPLNFTTVWTRHLEWWPRGDEFDPTDLDRLAEQHRREFPGAYFMWDISIYPPPDWRDANPDDMARDEQGHINTDCGDAEINYTFASQKAYDDMTRVMKKVIAYLEKAPYANRIVGYRINSGHTVEWLGWDPSRKGTILDFSPVAQKGFEAFAKAHYPWVTDYSVPTLAERRELDGTDLLWDQRKHARTIAYHDFYCTAVADGAIRMCRAAKAAVDGRKLVGTYFGYVMTLNAGGRNQMRAHYAMKHFLDAQATDFVMSPQNYTHISRQPGTLINDMKPFKSIQDHGMVSVIEDDTRTHNIMPVGYCQTLNEEMTVSILRRNMGVALCRNQPFYTYAITSGHEFDFPQFADDAAALAQAGAYALEKGVARKAEIAYIVSEEAMKSTSMNHGNGEVYVGRSLQTYDKTGKVVPYESLGGPKLAAWAYSNIYTELGRIGAGVDYLLAEDVADHPGNYKLYIFNGCTKLTPALLKAAETLRTRKCTILWTYAPGYTSNDGNSLANMKALTGLDFQLCPDVTEPGVTLADGSRTGALVYPKGQPALSPIFAVANPQDVIGRYTNGAAGLAASQTGLARTVFSGSYFLETPLMQRLAREAGVHIFSESRDVLEANANFLLFHARNAGKKTIRLPKKTQVIDVFNRRLVAEGVDCFEFDAPLHGTYFFYFGDDAQNLLARL